MYRKSRFPFGDPLARSVLRRLTAFLLLGAFLFGLNFHLFFLQLFGWSGMLVENREQSGSWMSAIEKTIDGETPCSVCRQVEIALNADNRHSESGAPGVENRIPPPLLIPLAGNPPKVEPPAVACLRPESPHPLPFPLSSDSPTPPPRTSVA